MTSQEKAKELVEKMVTYHWTDVCDYEGAKQCALVAVNEMINYLQYKWDTIGGSEYLWDRNDYIEVKQEIEKL